MDPTEIALEEYTQLLELFRFYFGLVLDTVTFTLGVTGGITAYVLKERKGYDILALIIPGVLCLGLGIGFILSRRYVTDLRERLEMLAETLGMGLTPHVSTLSGSLLLFGALLVVIGLALLIGMPVLNSRRAVSSSPTVT